MEVPGVHPHTQTSRWPSVDHKHYIGHRGRDLHPCLRCLSLRLGRRLEMETSVSAQHNHDLPAKLTRGIGPEKTTLTAAWNNLQVKLSLINQ